MSKASSSSLQAGFMKAESEVTELFVNVFKPQKYDVQPRLNLFD
jgi:hypothetical protein